MSNPDQDSDKNLIVQPINSQFKSPNQHSQFNRTQALDKSQHQFHRTKLNSIETKYKVKPQPNRAFIHQSSPLRCSGEVLLDKTEKWHPERGESVDFRRCQFCLSHSLSFYFITKYHVEATGILTAEAIGFIEKSLTLCGRYFFIVREELCSLVIPMALHHCTRSLYASNLNIRIFTI